MRLSPVRLQHILTEVRSAVHVEWGLTYTEIGVRSHGKGIFHKEPVLGEWLGDKNVYYVIPNTLVFNIVFAWEGAVAVTADSEAGMIASHRFPAYMVDPERADIRFLQYLFSDEIGLRILRNNSPGSAGRNKTLNKTSLLKEVVLLPDGRIQRAIAEFLDRKTAAIDALIEKKERLIALLAEKRAALIHQAVTKGLDPDVPMKDSGVPWIGEVPAHWEVKRLKQLAVTAIAGPYGSSLTKSMYSDLGHRVYGQQQVISGDFKRGNYRIDDEKFREMRRYEVEREDLLISVMGTIGRAAVVPEDAEPGIINPRLVLYRLDRDAIDPWFLCECIMGCSCQFHLKQMAQGSTMEGLSLGVLNELRVAVPPRPEQLKIHRWISVMCDKSNAAEVLLAQQIQKLKEYRQSLITAAVTGQLEIPP